MPDAVANSPHLKRVLGRWDLVLLFVVAIVNLNVVPSISANGAVTLWLWLLVLIFFFWPQAIAVIELSHRLPGEGGIYLWSKHFFGDFHGFLSGWCYWTNNVFYIPTILLYLVGVAVYVSPQTQALADRPAFTLPATLIALVVLVSLNIMGLGIGKWVNNLGGIGTAIIACLLISLGAAAALTHGAHLRLPEFAVTQADWRMISAFGTICFALVGLELASVMGDEIRDPLKVLPGAVAIGGVVSGVLYIGVTLTLLLALPKENIGVLQGVLQAITSLSQQVGVPWMVTPMVAVLSISIAGIASAWLSGSARIPFVAGLDRYLPPRLGALHPRFATPYVALSVHGVLSALFLLLSFAGAGVKEAFDLMLALAVVLQLVPFLYIYAALLKLSLNKQNAVYGPAVLGFAGASGLITTALGMLVAFIPPRQIDSVLKFEAKMIFGTLFFIGLAAFFFFSARKPLAKTAVEVL